jgi:uncharacterized protein (TIGR02466 family)
MKVVKNEWWVTPVWEIDTEFDDYFNQVLLADINNFNKIKKTDRYNIWDYDVPSFNKLKSKIIECLQVTSEYFPDWIGFDPQLPFGWINKNGPTTGLSLHAHESYLLVANYYVKCPKDCGDLLLVDPRGGVNWNWERELEPRPLAGIKYKRITPIPGKLVIFPAYIIHTVEQNNSKEDRVSIATNVANRFRSLT